MFTYLVPLVPRNGRERTASFVLAAGLLCLVARSVAFGQAAFPLTPIGQQGAPSLSHLYLHFLMAQNRQDRLAAKWDEQGRDGSIVRKRFQERLGFTDEQFALVRSTAQRLEAELQAVDAQAKSICDADHAANPRVPGTPQTWRPIPPELKALKQQREDLIQSGVSALRNALGIEPTYRLDTFLQGWVTPKSVADSPHPRPTPEQIRQRMIEARRKTKGGQP